MCVSGFKLRVLWLFLEGGSEGLVSILRVNDKLVLEKKRNRKKKPS